MKHERVSRGVTVDNVVDNGAASKATLWRIEAGKKAVREGEVWQLCRFYGTPEVVIDELTSMARATKEESGHDSGIAPVWLTTYLDMEESCSHLHVWHSALVHGLLQIESYSRAVITSDGTDDEEIIAARLRMFADRRAAFLERNERLLTMILASAVFTELTMGSPEVMAEQYEYLRECSRRPDIEIRILPAGMGIHSGIRGPFSLLDFPDPGLDPSVVYLESLTGAQYLDDPDKHVTPYRRAFESLCRLSVPIEEHPSP
jgi:hypothetical protein